MWKSSPTGLEGDKSGEYLPQRLKSRLTGSGTPDRGLHSNNKDAIPESQSEVGIPYIFTGNLHYVRREKKMICQL